MTLKEPPLSTSPTEALPTSENFQTLSWQKLLLKATGLSLLFVMGLLLITALGVGVFAYGKLNEFLSISGLTFTEAKHLVQQGLEQEPRKTNGKTTILILGIDTVANKESAPPLTDTMLLASIEYTTGKITLLSLPRDLWSSDYKTKINALYFYGQAKYPDQPERFPTEVVSQMTGTNIDYTVVFSLASIAEIVDILGGIDVAVPIGFVDTEFPRDDVDVSTVSDPELLYETIEFTSGTERMSAERVTKYIRSRHSQGDTGTDIDRAARQQLVITALIKEIRSRKVLTNPTTMAHLYTWYNQELSPFIPVKDGIGMAYALYPFRNQLSFNSVSLPIRPDHPAGVIEHLPPAQTDNQWTYSIVDLELFRSTVLTLLE